MASLDTPCSSDFAGYQSSSVEDVAFFSNVFPEFQAQNTSCMSALMTENCTHEEQINSACSSGSNNQNAAIGGGGFLQQNSCLPLTQQQQQQQLFSSPSGHSFPSHINSSYPHSSQLPLLSTASLSDPLLSRQVSPSAISSSLHSLVGKTLQVQVDSVCDVGILVTLPLLGHQTMKGLLIFTNPSPTNQNERVNHLQQNPLEQQREEKQQQQFFTTPTFFSTEKTSCCFQQEQQQQQAIYNSQKKQQECTHESSTSRDIITSPSSLPIAFSSSSSSTSVSSCLSTDPNFLHDLDKKIYQSTSISSSPHPSSSPLLNQHFQSKEDNESIRTSFPIQGIKKTSCTKKEGKKRKYVKSGLYRKDKNGNFIFSSSDRARLATMMQSIETTTTMPPLSSDNNENTNNNNNGVSSGNINSDNGICNSDGFNNRDNRDYCEEEEEEEENDDGDDDVNFMKKGVVELNTTDYYHQHNNEPCNEEDDRENPNTGEITNSCSYHGGSSLQHKDCNERQNSNCGSIQQSSSFCLFCREQRPIIQQQHSEMSQDKILLLLSEQWKVLPEAEKQKYNHVSEHELQLQNVASNMDYSINVQRVKRPLNAYNIFCKLHFEEVKREFPHLSINELSRLMGEKWKKLPEDEKKKYYDKVEHTPRFKKPLNSYNLFCKQHFEELKKYHPDKSINVLSKIIAEKWKELPQEEKKKFYEEAERQKNVFSCQLATSKPNVNTATSSLTLDPSNSTTASALPRATKTTTTTFSRKNTEESYREQGTNTSNMAPPTRSATTKNTATKDSVNVNANGTFNQTSLFPSFKLLQEVQHETQLSEILNDEKLFRYSSLL